MVQFRPWAPSVLRSSVLHYVAALRRVEALDGFDEDTLLYQHLPATAAFGENSIAGTMKNIRRGRPGSGLLSAGCYVDFKGGPKYLAMNELEDHNRANL